MINTEIKNKIGFIYLDRPEDLNALNRKMIAEIHKTLRTWEKDPAVKEVFFDSKAERGLCAGGDLKEIYVDHLQNDEAMDKLFRALKRHNFIFVDSRTSNKSVAKKYAKKYDMPYIVRNTFIDNDLKYNQIQNQLKDAIEIAKKNGYSIAIGHPHNITLEVLKNSKHLLKDVEPIFVNQLPYL